MSDDEIIFEEGVDIPQPIQYGALFGNEAEVPVDDVIFDENVELPRPILKELSSDDDITSENQENQQDGPKSPIGNCSECKTALQFDAVHSTGCGHLFCSECSEKIKCQIMPTCSVCNNILLLGQEFYQVFILN